jgi:hypothetical protein
MLYSSAGALGGGEEEKVKLFPPPQIFGRNSKLKKMKMHQILIQKIKNI